MPGTNELGPPQDRRLVNQFAINGRRNVGQMNDTHLQSSPFAAPNPSRQSFSRSSSGPRNFAGDFSEQQITPVASSRRRLTHGMSPASASFDPPGPPLPRHYSRVQNHVGGAGVMVDGRSRNPPSSSLGVTQPSMPAGTPSNNASNTYTQWGFKFRTTWQEFEQRGIQYFGINGAKLSSISGQPRPPETVRLVTPMYLGFPTSGISNTLWNDQQLRRIAFLPNPLRLDRDFLTGGTIYFFRQFGVPFEDMVKRTSDSQDMDRGILAKRLRQRERVHIAKRLDVGGQEDFAQKEGRECCPGTRSRNRSEPLVHCVLGFGHK